MSKLNRHTIEYAIKSSVHVSAYIKLIAVWLLALTAGYVYLLLKGTECII